MSQSFAGIQSRPYIGVPLGKPIKLYSPPTRQEGPRVVQFDIDWNVYWQAAGNPANLGVQLNLQQGIAYPISTIQSCYIDNTRSAVPIYVLFPDTGFVVVAAPNTTVFKPVFTNALVAIAYAGGLSAGAVPLSKVFLSNVIVNPDNDAEIQTVFPQLLGSPSIQSANFLGPGFGAPALGDQLNEYTIDITQTPVVGVPVFGTPYSSGFIYITSWEAKNYNDISTSGAALRVKLQTVGGGQVKADFQWNAAPVASAVTPIIAISSMASMNLRLDATLSWEIRNIIGATNQCGMFVLRAAWTYNTK